MRVTVGAKTDTGRVRESNQDSLLVQAPLFGVADGMGGHLAGDVASATAVEIVTKLAGEAPEDPERLADHIKEANRAIWTKAGDDAHLQGMGTTFTVAQLKDSSAHLAHVGDSRAYLLRDGELRQLTQDHTLVERMVQEGRLKREDAPHHPQRSIITRALGADQEVEVDTFEEEVREGDRILICSDGLSSMLDDDTIADALGSPDRPQQVAERLVELANEAGGEDNVSVVILDLGEADPDSPPGGASERAPTTVPATSAAVPVREARAVTPIPERDLEDENEASPSGSWKRRVIIALAILVIVLGGAYAAARVALGNSWFVGVDDTGEVVVYRGIPDEVAGFSFREERERMGLSIEDLCSFQRADVTDGIKAGSFDEARKAAVDIEERSRDLNCFRKSQV